MRDIAAPLPHASRDGSIGGLTSMMRREATISSPIGASHAFLFSTVIRSRQRFVFEPDRNGSTPDEPPPIVDSSAILG